MTGLERQLAPWREMPASAGVLTDFDGTLSAIVDDPEAALPLPGAAEVLTALARRYAKVAVISGRPVAYLLDRLGPLSGVALSGLYGLESGEQGAIHTLPEARQWREMVGRVAAEAETEAPPGVYIERKGLTLGVHFRQAPEQEGWVELWAAAQARRTGLVLHHGKMAVELVPPVDTDKGVVVNRLAEGLSAVCYLGDDLGDLAAFEALTRVAATGVATLSVAVRSEETPAPLLADADVVVEGPEGALAFLRLLDT